MTAMKFRSKGPIICTFLNDLKLDTSIYFNATRSLSSISALELYSLHRFTIIPVTVETPATFETRLTVEYLMILLEAWLVICSSRNRVPGPGSKIHYPVPNPGNWYLVFALITDEKTQLWPAFVSPYNSCDDFQLPSLFAAIVTVFVDVRTYIC